MGVCENSSQPGAFAKISLAPLTTKKHANHTKKVRPKASRGMLWTYEHPYFDAAYSWASAVTRHTSMRSTCHLHPARRGNTFGLALPQFHQILERAGHPGSQGLPLEAGLPEGAADGLELLLNKGITDNGRRGKQSTDSTTNNAQAAK